MSRPIAVQLYSVRDRLAADFAGTVRQIADIGYAGVETAGLPVPAEQAAKLFSSLGLTVCSAHTDFPTDETADEIVKAQKALGNSTIVSGFGDDHFTDEAAIRSCAAFAQHGAELAKAHGMRVGMHNHDHEFRAKVGDRYGYDLFLESAPDVFSQLDVFWAAHAGADPVKITQQNRSRLPYLHLKDGPAKKGWPMTAVGKGELNIPAIVGAADPNVLEWLVVELDACDTDMIEAVRDSYNYLVSTGLGHGR